MKDVLLTKEEICQELIPGDIRIDQKYDFALSIAKAQLAKVNKWLEEVGAYHYVWKEGEPHYTDTKWLEPLRIEVKE